MAKLTPVQFREKHARRLTSALEDVRLGVSAVTVAPTLKAAAAVAKMRQGIIDAIDNGKWARGLKRVDLEMWKKLMLEKGVDRIPAGIAAAAGKVEAFATAVLPYIDKGKVELDKMPDVTLADSIGRATFWIRHMAKFQMPG